MSRQNVESQCFNRPFLLFCYLLCFYGSLAIPWNSTSGFVFGISIRGYSIEPHLLLIITILLPMYFLGRSAPRTLAMRRVVLVCWTLTATGGLFLLGTVFSVTDSRDTTPMSAIVDVKGWFLLWMMPVTVIYIYARGLDRWLWHFLVATACYCVLLLIARATPYGWGRSFGYEASGFARLAVQNDYLLILAVPLAVARLQDRGFSLFVAIGLGLYLAQMAGAQSRTHMLMAAVLTLIAVVRHRRVHRTTVAVAVLVSGSLLVMWSMSAQQEYGLTTRLTNLGEGSSLYLRMLGVHNAIALEAIDEGGFSAYLFGRGFGTQLHLGVGEESYRRFVDNLWMTLIFKIGAVGALCVGGAIVYQCWGSARGRPLSSVDRVFKWWALLIPFLALRGSFLLWHTTSGVMWATLAVGAVLAERRRMASSKQTLVTREPLGRAGTAPRPVLVADRLTEG